jgi:serine/threonine protein kinase/Tfp pilus assembly protein PilF
VDPHRFRRVAELFDAAAALPSARRSAFLDANCNDPIVRHEVELLLSHDADPGVLQTGALHEVMSESLADSALPPPERIAGYRILREIGRGGMGVVYLAEQSNPKRQIALKVIRPGVSSPGTLRRFELEAQVLGRLQHPGIAQILEAGAAEIGGARQPYIAMEFVGGQPLAEYVNARGLGLAARVELVIRVCEAVQHAHQRGVIHRDLKPGNILVVFDDTGQIERGTRPGIDSSASGEASNSAIRARGQPKVLDFGVARLADDSVELTRVHTHAGQVVGTLAYMSPEQLSGDPLAVDTRTDVYALGVILFELLTGRLPLVAAGSSLADAMRTIQEGEVPRLTTLNRGVPRDLETITRKALEKEPARRYSSAAELAADLRRFLSDEPILARPPSLGYQFAKFTRRNRALVVGGSLAVLALILGTIGTTWQAWRATREMRRAENSAAEATRQTGIAKAVNDFLKELLTASDPEQSDAERDVRVSTVLERAEARLAAGALRDQPETELGIRSTLARMAELLGRFDAAQVHLRRLIALLKAAGKGDSCEAVSAENDIGSVLLAALRFDDAEPVLRSALERSRAICGPQSPETGTVLGNLGQVPQSRQQFDEARELLTESVRILAAAGPSRDRERAISLNNLGNVERDAQNMARAEPHYREAVAIIRRIQGDRSALLAGLLNNLGLTLKLQGKLADAEPLYREALEIRRAKLPEGHPLLAESLNNMGALLRDRQDFAAAEPYFRAALVIAEKEFPAGHPNISFTRRSVGICLMRMGRFAEAEPYLLQSYELLAANPATLEQARGTVRQIVYLYEHWNEAEPSAERAARLAAWQAKLPPASAPTSAPTTSGPSATLPAK